MVLRTDALCTIAQLELAIGVDATKLAVREQAIDTITEAILDWTARRIIHNPGLGTVTTEFHDGEPDQDAIFTEEVPISSVTTLHDDPDRAYGAATVLTEDTHFLVYSEEGRIQLIDSSGISILTSRDAGVFNRGRKNIRIVYVAGYTNNAALPETIRQACISWCAYLLNRQDSQGYTENSISLCRRVFERMSSTGPPMDVRTLLAAHRTPHIDLV